MDKLSLCDGDRESAKPYRYLPLLTLTSIRLLRVTGKGADGTVEVSLRIVDLEDNPSFCALSYTWGNPHANGVDFTAYFDAVNEEYSVGQDSPILCDGQRLTVQRNLRDVLPELL